MFCSDGMGPSSGPNRSGMKSCGLSHTAGDRWMLYTAPRQPEGKTRQQASEVGSAGRAPTLVVKVPLFLWRERPA